MSSSSSSATALSRIGKSDRLPPTMPTSGRRSAVRAHAAAPSSAPPRPRARAQSMRLVRRRGRSTVTWPILRRSKTSRLSYRWRWTPGSASARSTPDRAGPAARRPSRGGSPSPSRARLDRAQRQPGDRPDVLLELAGRGALDRPVAAVVDARRQLVHDERAIPEQEQLDGQRPARGRAARQPAAEGLGRATTARRPGAAREPPTRRGCRRRGGSARPGRRSTVPAMSRATTTEHSRDEGQLALEEEPAAPAGPAEAFERPVDIARVADPHLAPAVVAAHRDLEPERQPSSSAAVRSSSIVRTSRHGATAMRRRSSRNRRSASRSWVTSRAHTPGRTGQTPSTARRPRRPTCSSSYVTTSARSASRSAASTSAYEPTTTSSATDRGRACGVRVEDRDPVAHLAGGDAEHPAQLTAAEDADRRPAASRRLAPRRYRRGCARITPSCGRISDAVGGALGEDPVLEGRILVREGSGRSRSASRNARSRLVTTPDPAASASRGMDPEQRAVVDDRRRGRGAGRRERPVVRLALEPERERWSVMPATSSGST